MTTRTSIATSARLCLVTLCLAVSGCYAHGRLPLRDGNAPAYIGSISVRPDKWQRRSGRAGGGLELVYEHYSGDDVFDIGREATLKGVVIRGPETVNISADIDIARLTYTHRVKLGRYVELEPSAGVTYARRDVDLVTHSTPIRFVADHQSSFGFGGAIAPRIIFTPLFGIEGRISAAVSGPTGQSTSTHIALQITPTRTTAFRVGYYNHETSDAGDLFNSELELRMSGPLLSISQQF